MSYASDPPILTYATTSLMFEADCRGQPARRQIKHTWHLTRGFMDDGPALCGIAPPPFPGIWVRKMRDATMGGRFVVTVCRVCEQRSEPACEEACGCGERMERLEARQEMREEFA